LKKWIKTSSFVFALICALVIPFSSVFAGAGEWDYLGLYPIPVGHYATKTVKSGGGDFKVCVVYAANNQTFTYELYEDDSYPNPDDYVGKATLSEGQCKVFNVRDYVDGSNDKAELYLFREYKSEYVTVRFWD
jgi:hypothetical protein